MAGEVASSSSSMTRATTVAAEDEYSESSIDGVGRQVAACGGLEALSEAIFLKISFGA